MPHKIAHRRRSCRPPLAYNPDTKGVDNTTTEERMKLGFIDAGSWDYGVEITRLVMASHLSAERGKTIDPTDKAVLAELETYVPAIQQGKGAKQLL